MSTRSGFDAELQATEKTASQAQDLMSSLRETAMISPLIGFNMTAALQDNRTNKRSIIMQNKQKLRYRKSDSPGDSSAGSAPIPAPGLRRTQSTDDRTSTQKKTADIPEVRLTKSMDARPQTEKKYDKYGFILNMDSHGNVYEDDTEEHIPTFAETKREQRMEKQWNTMMQSWQYTRRRRKRLLRHLRRGIPDSMRGTVWALLGNVSQKIKDSSQNYEDLVRKSLESAGHASSTQDGVPRMRSESLVNSTSWMVAQDTIERDIHRTYPRHVLFHEEAGSSDEEDNELLMALNDDEVGSILDELCGKNGGQTALNEKNYQDATGGQAALRRVLRAYSVYDRDVGYCQGMNFIAGMFLTFMSEEQAFWLLVFVMNDQPCRMRGLFGEGMKETHQVLYIAERLTYQFLPKLAKHMETQAIHITMYATQWLLTLYTSSFQFDLVTKVWDCFLAEGWKIVYRVMLALLQHSQPALLKLNFEEILAFFRDLPKQTNGDEIIEIALKIPLRRRHLAKYQKEYLARQHK